jgi:hypothetical protein
MIFKKCQVNGVKYGELLRTEIDYPDGMAVSAVKTIRELIRKECTEKNDTS